MPDTNRTESQTRAHQIDQELMVVARAGLSAARLGKLEARLPATFGLNRVQSAGDDPELRAGELIQMIVEGAKLVEGKRLPAMTAALFGVEDRYRDLPYESRRGMAREIWDPEGVRQDSSWTRRPLREIRAGLAAALLKMDAAWTRGSSPPTDSNGLGPGTIRDQMHNSGLVRLGFKAETWLSGRGQRPFQTDWTFIDRVTREGIDSFRLFRKASTTLRVEPISDNVKSVTGIGTDVNGSRIWLATFDRPLELDEKIEWTTRTVYEDPQLDEVGEAEWIALNVSHLGSVGGIKRGHFVVHFDRRFPPKRVIRFKTPKGSLPDIDGPVEELQLDRRGTVNVRFADLEPWSSYGIFWWPA